MPSKIFGSAIPKLAGTSVPITLQRLIGQVMALPKLQRLYDDLAATRQTGEPLPRTLLRRLSIRYTAAEDDVAKIPTRGAVLLVVNHPHGILEGAVLADLLLSRRPDTKFLANGALGVIPELTDLLIEVDPLGGRRANARGMARALEHVEKGGLLVVFPAGEVSHFHWHQRSVQDPAWNPSVARLAELAVRRGAGLHIVPAFVNGANSLLFQIAGLVHPRARTLLLGRELLNKSGTNVDVRIGAAIPADKLLEIPGNKERTAYLRWRTYLLSAREQFRPNTRARAGRSHESENAVPVMPAVAEPLLAGDVDGLQPAALLATSGDLAVYIAEARKIPNVLREIGRLRELTFRAAGEGTGTACDLDEFDTHYLHLFVWNVRAREVVGAYRVARSDYVQRTRGLRGLYTATLFRFDSGFLNDLGKSLELGRSFVRAEYQRSFAPLLLLWKGIGRFVARNPQYRVLFGPVSISNNYSNASRQLMVGFLERYAGCRAGGHRVSPRHPFRKSRNAGRLLSPPGVVNIEAISSAVADLEAGGPGLPVLLRQYLKLGGRLLAFNVDPNFSSALDGLIVVDLTQAEPKLLERYLGKAEAAQFLEFQKGRYGAHESLYYRQLGLASDGRVYSAADAIL